MIYKAIGVMSGSSLDGLDLVFVAFTETGGKWEYEILGSDCLQWDESWKERLQSATTLNAREFQLLDVELGKYIGAAVNALIDKLQLHHQVHLVASHGHTVFHLPELQTTVQIGKGATIAAITQLPVVNDLRSLDVALGGQGAPIVPIGEKLLFPQYPALLNIGGIANLTLQSPEGYQASDLFAANQVFNELAKQKGQTFDAEGQLASMGTVHPNLLMALNALTYYSLPFPKSLSNDFSREEVLPLIQSYALPVEDAMATYVEHVCQQLSVSLKAIENGSLLVTGGGAFNTYLIQQMQKHLFQNNIQVMVPEPELVNFKEALIMALMGVLRWREETNVLSSVTGARYNSIGGALWLGGEA